MLYFPRSTEGHLNLLSGGESSLMAVPDLVVAGECVAFAGWFVDPVGAYFYSCIYLWHTDA